MKRGYAVRHTPPYHMISSKRCPIFSMRDTTKALPTIKCRWRSGIPVLVQLSGKPLICSHSKGVSRRIRPVPGSRMMYVLRLLVPSLVSIVRAGLSNGSGKAMGPSENVYSNPVVFGFRSTYLAPFIYLHLSNVCLEMKKCSSPPALHQFR